VTEEEARAWLVARNVSRETFAALERFVALLIEENSHQNLISAATIPNLWSRHIVDSVQLLDLAPGKGSWIDLGSGPGFPGLIIAALGDRPVTLIEERTKRVAFLRAASALLGIADRTHIVAAKVERVPSQPFAVISARAFAPLPRLLTVAEHLSDKSTLWVLPKGRNAEAELAGLDRSWQGNFEVVPSVTDSESAIIVATGVSRGKGRR